MNRQGPIIIIEDDRDDQEILKEVFDRLSLCGNCCALVFFTFSLLFSFFG